MAEQSVSVSVIYKAAPSLTIPSGIRCISLPPEASAALNGGPLCVEISNAGLERNVFRFIANVVDFNSASRTVCVSEQLYMLLQQPEHVRIRQTYPQELSRIDTSPYNDAFTQRSNRVALVRSAIRGWACISKECMIKVEVDGHKYDLVVTSVYDVNSKPITCGNLSAIDTLDIRVQKPQQDNDDDSDSDNQVVVALDTTHQQPNTSQNEGAIVSNISHTMGNGDQDNSMHTLEGSQQVTQEVTTFDGQDDDDGAWSDDAEFEDSADDGAWGDMEEKKEIPDLDDDGFVGERNDSASKPRVLPPNHRGWICACSQINNTLASFKRGWKCINCPLLMKPSQALVECQEEICIGDFIVDSFNVWVCDKCERINEVMFKVCDQCATGISDNTFRYTSKEKPVRKKPDKHYHVPDSHEPASKPSSPSHLSDFNRKKEPAPVSKPALSIYQLGTICEYHSYPASSVLKKLNARLVEVFGVPYRVTLPQRNSWARDTAVARLSVQSALKLNVQCRSVAMNERDGRVASMDKEGLLQVFAPVGGRGYMLTAKVQRSTVSAKALRMRFVDDMVYLLCANTRRITVYVVADAKDGEECGEIHYVQTLFDDYFAKAQIVDFQVTRTHLYILFDKWVGVYHKKDAVDIMWHHAVSFCKKTPVSTAAFEMRCYEDDSDCSSPDNDKDVDKKPDTVDNDLVCSVSSRRSIKNLAFINVRDNLVAVHLSNPMFDLIHVASKTPNGTVFCPSRHHGVFYFVDKKLYQSPRLSAINVHVLWDLSAGEQNTDSKQQMMLAPDKQDDLIRATEFLSVQFDENFGVSGRLLVWCLMVDGSCKVFQMFSMTDLRPLEVELRRIGDYVLRPGCERTFSLWVSVFEMLYGVDVVTTFVESALFNPAYVVDPALEYKSHVQVEDVDDAANKEKEPVEEEDEEEEEEGCGGAAVVVDIHDNEQQLQQEEQVQGEADMEVDSGGEEMVVLD